MKTKIIAFLLLFCTFGIKAFSQLRVDPYGRIGMGTDWPNSEYKCHIKGNLLLTTYPEIAPPYTSFVELKFKVGNGSPGVEIGSSCDKIAFWTSTTSYNQLYAEAYYTQSDSTTKKNISKIENSLEKIKGLQSHSYQLKDDQSTNKQRRYGFLAQEVQKVLPEITDTSKGIMLIDYSQITPLLVEAFKEQNKAFEELKKELERLKTDMASCCNSQKSIKQSRKDVSSSENYISGSKLFQNKPNPFSEETIIEFEIMEKYTDAAIIIFDMQGALKKKILITQMGKGQITLNGRELTPGMYFYSLVIDKKEIDMKRMILID